MTNILLAIAISASIDSTSLMLGDQTKMNIQVTAPAIEQVQAPDFAAQLPKGVECISASKMDTTVLEDGDVQLSQELVLTSFGDTTYFIQPYVVTTGGDTVKAHLNTLTILMPDSIETMKDIYDIKSIEDVPVWWWDIVKWIVLVLGILLLGIGGYFIWRWYMFTYRRPQAKAEVPVNTRPADEEALERLAIIGSEKIWQQGKGKQYHTELTDVVRTYIGRRFDVHSTEKTSDETLHAMKPLIDKELYTRLAKMLQLADFVKFAKYEAMPNENEQALDIAYDFVYETTPKKEEEKGKEA